MCKSCTDPQDQRTRNGMSGGIQDYGGAAVNLICGVDVPGLGRFGTIQDCQDATVRLNRGVGIPRTMLWHASGF
eukprot:1855706-Pyramimonas_sp.AAC.1